MSSTFKDGLIEIRSNISKFKQEATLRQSFINELNKFAKEKNLPWAEVLPLFQLEEIIGFNND